MSTPGLAPRRAAVQLMDAVLDDKQMLSDLLPGAVEHLDPDERARAGRLATNALRWMDRADRILGRYLKSLPPTTVMNTLRLGAVEICVDGAAAHGVVNTAVELIRKNKQPPRHAGLVNAVLRKVARDAPDKWPTLPNPQMPKWLRKPLIADFGKATIKAIEAAQAKGAPLDLTVKSDPQKWADTLGGQVLPTGSVRLNNAPQISGMAGYEAGNWWVQDAAAAMPVALMRPKPGERVLDLCAAPGGKTMQLAAAGAEVTAVDISGPRMARVQENLKRTGLSAEIIVGDALQFSGEPFDAVLLDAPCSATGTIRRHPDLPYAKDGSGFEKLFKLQADMLDQALRQVAPGGRLVYCTCSLLFDEGEEQIKDLLARMDGVSVDRGAFDCDGIDVNWVNQFGLRTRPDYWSDSGGIDGFFMTVLRKLA